jgi:hypothetical protein
MPPSSDDDYGPDDEPLLSTSAASDGDGSKSPPFTIADLFSEPPALGVCYHVCAVSYDIGTPVGAVLGALSAKPLFSKVPFWQVVGNGGLMVGFGGLALGAITFTAASRKLFESDPPFDKEGILDRRDRLGNNTIVRSLDAGTSMGLVVAGLAMGVFGRSTAMALRPGYIGALQGLTLGASSGSLLAQGYLYLSK